MAKRMYKKRSTWTESDESLLIQLWEENIDHLRGNRKNSHIYKEISDKMADFGHNFTPNEISIKVHNLTSKYRMERKKIGPSGGSPSTWTLYNKVHSIVGNHKCNKVEELMEDSLSVDSNCSIEVLEGYETEVSFLCETEAIPENPTSSLFTQESIKEKKVNIERKSKKRSFQKEILEEIKESKQIMKQDLEERKEIDSKMLKLQEELVKLEREKIEIFKKILQ